MSQNRVNIKVDEETRNKLKQFKRPRETWDHLLFHAARALNRRRNNILLGPTNEDSVPICLECGDVSPTWTARINGVLCPNCMEGLENYEEIIRQN